MSIFTVFTGSFSISGAATGKFPQLGSLHILDRVVTDAAAQQPRLGGWIFLQDYLGRGHSLSQLQQLLSPVESHGDLLEVGGHLLQTRLPGKCLRLVLGRHGLRRESSHLKNVKTVTVIT